MKKLAIVVPTYNRSNSVAQLVGKYSEFCIRYDINLFFYDSSEDDLTEKIFKNENFQNVFYLRVPSQLHSGEKVYNIYKEFVAKPAYDYVWLHHDSMYHDAASMATLFSLFEKNYHLVIVARETEGPEITEYTAAQPFFDDNLWETTLFGATIVSQTFLKSVDFNYLSKKYLVPNRINFSHIGFYFEYILKVENFGACRVIGCKRENTQSRMLSGWVNEMLRLWLWRFPYFVKSLPDIYKNKRKAILKANRKGGAFSYTVLIEREFQKQVFEFGIMRTLIAWKLYSGFGLMRLFVFFSYLFLRKLGLLPAVDKLKGILSIVRSGK